MKCASFAGFLPLFIAGAALAGVNVPRGYYLVNLTQNDGFNRWCNINNHGQIVWSTGFDPFDGGTYEIMLYDAGEIRQITDNAVYDDYPDINDAGQIVWSSATGPGGEMEIWLYENGVARKIQDESLQALPKHNRGPRINHGGLVVWNRNSEPLCASSDTEIWMYDGTQSFQLSFVGGTNVYADINSAGEVVWARVDYCGPLVTSQMLMLSNGTVSVVSGPETQIAGIPAISDIGRIYYSARVDTPYEMNVTMWENGVRTEISPWGMVGRVSDNGLVLTFNRWFESNRTWQVVIMRDGQETQLTDDPFWNADAACNSMGEVAWTYGTSPHYQTRAILRFESGDLNCNHQIGISDIPSFVLALTRPAVYDQTHPSCDALLADVNEDGVVSVGDIAGFVSLLLLQ